MKLYITNDSKSGKENIDGEFDGTGMCIKKSVEVDVRQKNKITKI